MTQRNFRKMHTLCTMNAQEHKQMHIAYTMNAQERQKCIRNITPMRWNTTKINTFYTVDAQKHMDGAPPEIAGGLDTARPYVGKGCEKQLMPGKNLLCGERIKLRNLIQLRVFI